ncbi:solute carrier family 25 member 36-like [Saccoglossus kowalevskii]|uniref:Solute carrier family 25 member 36-like n=1 Tax=Saccoglossus kowalevskii TaxID=10224 RepID=A0ABM0MDM2_SACKO|nr:PREDICTED: solute carrier family 25 member 36-like [Saccoglossus kowalevskii]
MKVTVVGDHPYCTWFDAQSRIAVLFSHMFKCSVPSDTVLVLLLVLCTQAVRVELVELLLFVSRGSTRFSIIFVGFTACTFTNPIWLVKTRLQLDQRKIGRNLGALQCIQSVYRKEGLRGFYRGVTASYAGISETVIHFVIYEHLKKTLREKRGTQIGSEKSAQDFMEYMLCGACSKTCASILAYPHEVVRTRLREEGTKYRSFIQTLATVAREEGPRALYRGLATQLVRQIPNTAIMMSTYEAVVYLLTVREPIFSHN